MKSWKVTAQAWMEDKGEQPVVIFVRAETKQDAKKNGLRSIIRMPGVISVGPVEAVDTRFDDAANVNPEVS